MATAQLMEEQLQQNARVSSDGYQRHTSRRDHNAKAFKNNAGDADEDRGSSEEEQSDRQTEDNEDDGDGDAAHDDSDEESEGVPASPVQDRSMRRQRIRRRAKGVPDEQLEDDADAEEEEQGVGAVKLRPGEADVDDDGSDAGSDENETSDGSDQDSAVEGAWEADNADDVEEDEESDTAAVALCVYCKQDEDSDPAEDFEAFLACADCDEHAHQQCARENNDLDPETDAESWRCHDCVADSEPELSDDDKDLTNAPDEGSPSTVRKSAGQRLAGDLLPSHRGAIKPDSHSVFSHLVLDEDPMDGSRMLRKRKSSSAADGDEDTVALRKRRKSDVDHNESDDEVVATENDSRPRSSRSLRLKISTNAPATVVKKSRTVLVLRIRVGAADLREILSKKPAGPKRRARPVGGGRVPRPTVPRQVEPSPVAPFSSSNYSQPFYSFFDKDTDELKGRPYGGILTEAEADTSKTLPAQEDRRRFDDAKQKAEEDWKKRIEEMQEKEDAPVRKSRKASGPGSQIECIEFGGWEIETWYAAPYPEEYSRNRVLFICEYCLKYMNSDYVAWRHKLKCPAKHPPGDEIYRDKSVSVFEVDGRKHPVYCQNLCLLAKLFLGSKTLYYDVEPFLFYVLCEYDELGYHFVGYFSKEKRASSQNNVSCILTLPIHQRKGYGNLLIDFSYLLTRVEEKTGSPEKPLSDMGLVSYRNYWRLILSRYLLEQISQDPSGQIGLSIRQISDDTGLTPDDVIAALEGLRCLVRDEQTELYAFRIDVDFCKQYVEKWEAKKYVQLNPLALTWTPYVMGRNNAANFEIAPTIHTIAPREEEEEQKTAVAVLTEALEGGEVTLIVPPADAVKAEPKLDNDRSIMESTEPNDDVSMSDAVEIVDRNDLVQHDDDKENHWIDAYKDIPPTRFTVYPPAIKRSGLGRAATSIVRAPAGPRNTPRRPPRRAPLGMSASRSSASRPRTSRPKNGGTGRGPGRWPKGTKKSDYGNADSGPGLPPAWAPEKPSGSAASMGSMGESMVNEMDVVGLVTHVHPAEEPGEAPMQDVESDLVTAE